MRFRSILKNRDLFVVSALSLRERVARQAPGEGSPSHDFQKSTNGGAGCPHPALAAPPSPDGRRTRPSFSNLFRTALAQTAPTSYGLFGNGLGVACFQSGSTYPLRFG